MDQKKHPKRSGASELQWIEVKSDDAFFRRLPLFSALADQLDPLTGVATVVGVFPELSGVSSIVFVPDPVIPVQIDVKPDDDQNAINPGSKGVIPVAIFSTDDFDATSIDPATIELAGAGVAVVGKGKSLFHEVDVNDDGLVDLLCQVETESLTLEPDAGEVWLIGETYDGQLIEVYSFIFVVPNNE